MTDFTTQARALVAANDRAVSGVDERMPAVTLTEFLLEQIAADEAVARAGGADAMTGVFWKQLEPDAYDELQKLALKHAKRVLAVCEAHRRIVEMGPTRCPFADDEDEPSQPHYPDAGWLEVPHWDACPTCADSAGADAVWRTALRAIAAIYADRDGFREEWR